MQLLVKNIACLVNIREEHKLLRGEELSYLPCIEDTYLIIRRWKDQKSMEMTKEITSRSHHSPLTTQHYKCQWRYVLLCWCDSHTYLVFAASREEEFVDKIKVFCYRDIAAKGRKVHFKPAHKLNAL